MKIVYQTDVNGMYAGEVEADESPLEPGVYLIPAGCVETAPPAPAPGYDRVWQAGAWVLVPQPVENASAARAAMSLTRRQVIIGMVTEGLLSAEEGVAMASSGAAPDAVAGLIAAMPSAKQIDARITLASFTVAERLDPIVAMFQAAGGLSDAQMDRFFSAYAAV